MSDKLYQLRNDPRHIMECATLQNATDLADRHLIEKALRREVLLDLDHLACGTRVRGPALQFWKRLMPEVLERIDVKFAPARRAVARLISGVYWQDSGAPGHCHPLGPHARCRR